MAAHTEAGEIAVVVVSYILVLSVILYWVMRSHSMFSMNTRIRRVWCHEILNTKTDALLGVQTFRNSTMAANFIAVIMAGAGFSFVGWVSDPTRVNSMNLQAAHDPLTAITSDGNVLISATAKLYVCIYISLFSFFAMTQSIRLVTHLSYFYRAAGSYGGTESTELYNNYASEISDITVRSQQYFMIGLRFFYTIIPTIAWFFGATYLLVTACILSVLIWFADSLTLPRLPLRTGARGTHGSEAEAEKSEDAYLKQEV